MRKSLLIVVTGVLFAATFLQAAEQAPTAIGSIKAIEGPGDILIFNFTQKPASRKAAVSGPLYLGDKMITAENQSLAFTLQDKSELVLGSTSNVTLKYFRQQRNMVSQLREVIVELRYGHLGLRLLEPLGENDTFAIIGPEGAGGPAGRGLNQPVELLAMVHPESRRLMLFSWKGEIVTALDLKKMREALERSKGAITEKAPSWSSAKKGSDKANSRLSSGPLSERVFESLKTDLPAFHKLFVLPASLASPGPSPTAQPTPLPTAPPTASPATHPKPRDPLPATIKKSRDPRSGASTVPGIDVHSTQRLKNLRKP